MEKNPKYNPGANWALAVISISIVATSFSFLAGNISSISTPYDMNGDACGYDIINNAFLYYPDPTLKRYPVCVPSCPSNSTKGTIAIPHEADTRLVEVVSPYPTSLCLGHFCLKKDDCFRSGDNFSTSTKLHFLVGDLFKAGEFFSLSYSIGLAVSIMGIIFLSQQRARYVIANTVPHLYVIIPLLLFAYFTIGFSPLSKTWIALLCVVILISIGAKFVEHTLGETLVRSELFMFIGIEALVGMPKLLCLLCISCIIILIACVYFAIGIINLLSWGPHRPISVGDDFIGVDNIFVAPYPLWQSVGIGFIIAALYVSVETTVSFAQFVTCHSVKAWVQYTQQFGTAARGSFIRSAIADSWQSYLNILAPVCCSACRLPSMIMQWFVSEEAATMGGNPMTTRIIGWLYHVDTRIHYNKLGLMKSFESPAPFHDCNKAGYFSVIQGTVSYQPAGKRYMVAEMCSSLYSFLYFYSLFLSVTAVEFLILMNSFTLNEGEKELFFPEGIFFAALLLTFIPFLIFFEALETASFCILDMWISAVNASDGGALPLDFCSNSLATYIQFMQRTAHGAY